LKAGTKFGEPVPLFPRAEKDAVERMQNLEDQNNRTVVEAASAAENAERADKSAPQAPASALAVEPAPAAASPSVVSVQPTGDKSSLLTPGGSGEHNLTQATVAPATHGTPVEAIPVKPIPAELATGRLSTTPADAPAGTPLQGAEQPAATSQAQHINIDDFAKVELRVAQILEAERIPKADKLLKLQVDLGYEKRQILAGIAQYYEPEKLIGRKIVIVANLAPRKMRGLESNGMLLAASLEDGAPVLAGFLEEVPLGARLK
jgi:methionyl-tRNA synthetase